jgi:hypothetical protein
MNTITLIGFSIILFYCVSQILNFFGIGQEVYGAYVLFYAFLIICILILPHDYPKV